MITLLPHPVACGRPRARRYGRSPGLSRRAGARVSLAVLSVLFLAGRSHAADPGMQPLIEDVYTYAQAQNSKTITLLQQQFGGDYLINYPRQTDRSSGKWTVFSQADTLSGWTAGFFPGSLWMTYRHTNDPALYTLARNFTAGIESAKSSIGGSGGVDHDQGFRFLPSFYNAYQSSNDVNDPGGVYRNQIKGIMNTVATGLDARFNMGGVPVGAIRAYDAFWEPPYPVEIDSFMNYPLLFAAWDLNGRPTSGPARQWYDHAVTQARTQIAQHIRTFGPADVRASDNGGTYHIVQHNDGTWVQDNGTPVLTPANGAVYNKFTNQGFAAESTWSRGQAWAMYGLTETYRYTRGDASVNPGQFLAAARQASDYFISHLPDNYTADPYNHVTGDLVPPTDFDAALGEKAGPWNGATMNRRPPANAAPQAGTHTYTFRDSSAAAAGASALLALSQLDPDPARREEYFTVAEDILRCLITFRGSDSVLDYLAKDTNQMSILTEASGAYTLADSGSGWSFADYYFLEALDRYEAIVVPEPAGLGLLMFSALLVRRRGTRR